MYRSPSLRRQSPLDPARRGFAMRLGHAAQLESRRRSVDWPSRCLPSGACRAPSAKCSAGVSGSWQAPIRFSWCVSEKNAVVFSKLPLPLHGYVPGYSLRRGQARRRQDRAAVAPPRMVPIRTIGSLASMSRGTAFSRQAKRHPRRLIPRSREMFFKSARMPQPAVRARPGTPSVKVATPRSIA